MAVNAPRPRRRSVSDIKSNLLRPATTSHFDVFVQEPSMGNWSQFKSDNQLSGFDQNFLHLCCSETVLPGSSLATTEINNDFTGVTERHAYRRLFDDRIDLTFYVMQDQSVPTPDSILGRKSLYNQFAKQKPSPNSYLPIRLFEGWIKYIANESLAGENSIANKNYSYRMRYPEEYYGGIAITKYERDYNHNMLKYNFIGAYPISVSSIPVSYDASDLLKCTVSFSYIRYFIEQVSGNKDILGQNPFAEITPLTGAQINQSFTNPIDFGLGNDYSKFTVDNGIFNQSLNGGQVPFITEGFL
jgi:hypothetical protein